MFAKARKNLDGYQHTCKSCTRNTYLKWNYGISSGDYDRLLIEQNYSCWICKIHEDDYKENLHVDHDHSTGEVRGLLCAACNLLLGKAKDNITILENAIEYLNK
jgi:hypothetical protein